MSCESTKTHQICQRKGCQETAVHDVQLVNETTGERQKFSVCSSCLDMVIRSIKKTTKGRRTMTEWKQYKRKGLSEMTPYREGMDISGVSFADVDIDNGSPRPGDMIARNPKNHSDKWLVAEKYFLENFEPAKDGE